MGSEEASPKLRLLALHGFRFNGAILKKQLSKWSPAIHELLDITYLDAPFPAQGESTVKDVYPGPYFEWMQPNEDYTEFLNHEEAILYILDFMEKNGPFDGILGFSMGAVIGSCIVGLQEKKKVIKGKSAADLPPIRFQIAISGAYLRDPNVSDVYSKDHPSEIPTLQMIGAKDHMFLANQVFLKFYKDPVVLNHPQGHTVPRLDEAAVSTVVSFLKGIQSLKAAEETPVDK